MYTLYYSKGFSALAPHILALELGVDLALVEVPIPQGAHQAPEFLARNPKGRVPLLDTPEGGLSENPAILEYLAARHPQRGLLPEGHLAQARARELCAYLCATAHIAFAHKLRGKRWARDPVALADMQKYVPQNLTQCATYLESTLPLGPWALGADYSFCDPYLYVFARWLDAAGVPIDPFPKLAAHKLAMLARPATQAALAAQEIQE